MKFREHFDFGDFSLLNPPIISSDQANWDELRLVFSRQPAGCIPDHVAVHHTLCVNIGNSITLERTVDGRSQTIDAIPVGDIGFYPANLHQMFQWH